jgi:hypothetical protein
MISSRLPAKVIVVAILFFLGGTYGFYQQITILMAGHIHVSLDFLGLLVAYGILRRQRGWRICGLIMLWLYVFSFLFTFIWLLVQVATGRVTSSPDSGIYVAMNFGVLIAGLIAQTWMIRILVSSEVRKLFGLEVTDAALPS